MGDIVRDIEKRVINGFMDFLILSALKNDGDCLSGYDVIKYIYMQFVFFRVLGRLFASLCDGKEWFVAWGAGE